MLMVVPIIVGQISQLVRLIEQTGTQIASGQLEPIEEVRSG